MEPDPFCWRANRSDTTDIKSLKQLLMLSMDEPHYIKNTFTLMIRFNIVVVFFMSNGNFFKIKNLILSRMKFKKKKNTKSSIVKPKNKRNTKI